MSEILLQLVDCDISCSAVSKWLIINNLFLEQNPPEQNIDNNFLDLFLGKILNRSVDLYKIFFINV